MGANPNVRRDMSKVLNKRLIIMNGEKQDGEDDLFGKLVAVKLKSLPQREKYRLKHKLTTSF